MVAADLGPEAVATQDQNGAAWAAAVTVAAAGVAVLLRAMAREASIRSIFDDIVTPLGILVVVVWVMSPLFPARRWVSTSLVVAIAAGFSAVVASVDRGALAGASASLFGALVLSMLLGVVGTRLRSGLIASTLRRGMLFSPLLVAFVLLYVPAGTSVGAWLGPPTPLGVAAGAIAAVAVLFQDQVGQRATRFRHAPDDVEGTLLTRIIELPRSMWLLVWEAMGVPPR